MHNHVTVRRASPEDALDVADVYLASFRATYDFPLSHTDDEVRVWVRDDLLLTTETWVAAQAGSVVGFLSLGDQSVAQLYVAPAWTGHGIGSRLIQVAKERRPMGLDLHTFQVNSRARHFYERHGFHIARLYDGSHTEERQPDMRYVWRGGGR